MIKETLGEKEFNLSEKIWYRNHAKKFTEKIKRIIKRSPRRYIESGRKTLVLINKDILLKEIDFFLEIELTGDKLT